MHISRVLEKDEYTINANVIAGEGLYSQNVKTYLEQLYAENCEVVLLRRSDLKSIVVQLRANPECEIQHLKIYSLHKYGLIQN